MKPYTEKELRERLARTNSLLRALLSLRAVDDEHLTELEEEVRLHAAFAARYGFALLRLEAGR